MVETETHISYRHELTMHAYPTARSHSMFARVVWSESPGPSCFAVGVLMFEALMCIPLPAHRNAIQCYPCQVSTPRRRNAKFNRRTARTCSRWYGGCRWYCWSSRFRYTIWHVTNISGPTVCNFWRARCHYGVFCAW